MRAAILQSVLLFSVTAVLFAFRGVERAQQRQFAQGIARAAHGEKDLAQKCEDPRAVYDTRSAAQDSDDRAHRGEYEPIRRTLQPLRKCSSSRHPPGIQPCTPSISLRPRISLSLPMRRDRERFPRLHEGVLPPDRCSRSAGGVSRPSRP